MRQVITRHAVTPGWSANGKLTSGLPVIRELVANHS